MPKIIIEIINLNYHYPDGTPALSGINVQIGQGESWGIVGPNGAGKSTLLYHLNGIMKGRGIIKVGGLEIGENNLMEVRRKVGLVFQDPDNQLFMPTVFDDVAFGPENMRLSKEEVEIKVAFALQKVDMTAAKERSSHHLSFGERKRVSIATVLSMDPKILALDEPTSNMDPKHRRELIDFLNSLSLTKVIATHDLGFVLQTCSKVLMLNRGKIVAQGPVKELLENKSLLYEHGLC